MQLWSGTLTLISDVCTAKIPYKIAALPNMEIYFGLTRGQVLRDYACSAIDYRRDWLAYAFGTREKQSIYGQSKSMMVECGGQNGSNLP